MSATPYLVLNRSNRRVLHQAATLEEAKGFCAGHPRPTAIAMLAQGFGREEWSYVVRAVNFFTGEVLMQSPPMELCDAHEALLGATMILLPRPMAEGVAK